MRFLAVAMVFSGCMTTATLATQRGPLEATIKGGDEESLVVATETGLTRRVRREDVLEIDHPGNVLATVFGLTVGGLGLELTAFASTGLCAPAPRGSGPAPCIAIGSVATASLALFAYGLWAWISSRNAVVNPPPESEGDLTKIPLFAPPPPCRDTFLPPPPPP